MKTNIDKLSKMKYVHNQKTFLSYFYQVMPFILILGILVIWGDNNFKFFVGDDIFYIISQFEDKGFIGTMLDPNSAGPGKFRPIAYIFLYIVYIICGLDYSMSFLVLRFWYAIAAFIIFRITNKIGIPYGIAIVISLLSITTPFSLYATWQLWGVSETLSLILMALIFYEFVLWSQEVEKNKRYKHSMVVIVLFTMLIFNAERFMYVLGTVGILIITRLLKNKDITIKESFSFLFYMTIPIILRSCILQIMNVSALSTGRGGIQELLETFIPYALKGFINMCGFALGDGWHGGFGLLQIPNAILIINSVLLLIALFFIMNMFGKSNKNSFMDVEVEFILIVFSLSSLFSYALVAGTHGEDRYLLIPYIFWLIAVVKSILYVMKNRFLKHGILILFFVGVLVSNSYYLQAKDHVHFRYAEVMAETCMENINLLSDTDKIENIVCFGSNDYKWVFADQNFFKYYVRKDITTYYVASFEDIPEDINKETTIIVYPNKEYKIPYGVKANWYDENYIE